MRFVLICLFFNAFICQAQKSMWADRNTLWQHFSPTPLPLSAGGADDNWFSLKEAEAAAVGLTINDSIDERKHPFTAYRARVYAEKKLPCTSPAKTIESNPEFPLIPTIEIRWVEKIIQGPHLLDSIGRHSVFNGKSWKKYNPHLIHGAIPSKAVRVYVPDIEIDVIDSLLALINYEEILVEKEMKSFSIRVRSGETLSSIALREQVSVNDLKKWNGLNNDRIFVGQELQIFAEKTIPQQSETNTKTQSYTVKDGDSLWEIARKYPNVEVEDILIINNKSNDVITVGEVLLIPVK